MDKTLHLFAEGDVWNALLAVGVGLLVGYAGIEVEAWTRRRRERRGFAKRR